MPKVNVGILRNNLWSLRLDMHTNLLFSDIRTIDIHKLKPYLKEYTFPEFFTIQLGDLMLKKEQGSWIVTFPGISLTFQDWIVCRNTNQQNTLRVLSSDADIHDLLEFVIHMFSE